jgi:hypothetical protein
MFNKNFIKRQNQEFKLLFSCILKEVVSVEIQWKLHFIFYINVVEEKNFFFNDIFELSLGQ